MKIKNLKLMLLGLFGLMSTAVSAQNLTENKYFPYGDFIYKVITPYNAATGTKGTVSIEAIRSGRIPVDAEGKLKLVGNIDATILEENFKADVLYVTSGALQQYKSATLGASAMTGTDAFDHIVDAKSVVIPKEFTTVQDGTFEGYTNINSITFEEGSQLTTVQPHAFTTTQTKVFDFRPCTKLYTLPDEAFVETDLTNTYITTVTLPDHSGDDPVQEFTLGMSLKSLPSLTTINNLDKCNVQKIVADAFNGDISLTTLVVPASVTTIKDAAFQLSGIKHLTINVGNLTTFGEGAKSLYGAVGTGNPEILEDLTLVGVLNTAIAGNAFEGCANLATLELSEMAFQPKTTTINGNGQFATHSFKDCTSLKTVVLPTLQGSADPVIADNAFAGCTALKEVQINAIKSTNGGVGAAAFGNALKTVKIGTIEAGNGAVAAGAFVYGDVVNATLSLAADEGEYLKSSAASLLGAAAFDFSNVKVTADRTDADYPTVQIGEIKSANIFAAGALKGNLIQSITFTGDIDANGLATQILHDNADVANTANLELKALTFNGKLKGAASIAGNVFAGLTKLETITFDGDINVAGGIATNAFADLTSVVTVTFNGDLKAAGAIAAGAFDNLVADSEIHYTKDGATNTINPFAKTAFDDTATPRDIKLIVTDATLAAKYADGTIGLGTEGTFDVYRVIFEANPVASTQLKVYVNQNGTTQAWARAVITSTTSHFNTITRVQNIDGVGEVKLTLYGTYTDEDPFAKQSTVYMVPLKAIGGKYYIKGVNAETLIAKVEKIDNSAFSAADFQIPEFTITDAEAATEQGVVSAESSIWPQLVNTKLHVAGNIMTNQQLNDGTANDTNGSYAVGTQLKTWIDGTPTTEICKDLYFFSDPSKHKGFNVKKIPVTNGNNAYINVGFYYMLLAKFNDEAEARVVWLGEDDNVTSILGVKKNVKSFDNDAIYTLQGVRVDEIQKGQVYIKNGKKFIAQ